MNAAVSLLVGHDAAYGARSYIGDLLSGRHGFPSADERSLIIGYGYPGWCIGPLVATVLLLVLRRPPAGRPYQSLHRPEEPASGPGAAAAISQYRWGALSIYAFMGSLAAYVLTANVWFFVVASLAGIIAFCVRVVTTLWRFADRAARRSS